MVSPGVRRDEVQERHQCEGVGGFLRRWGDFGMAMTWCNSKAKSRDASFSGRSVGALANSVGECAQSRADLDTVVAACR